jgi:DNA polymerase III alpha subunit
MGLTVRPPHVNYSSRNFSVSNRNGQKTLFMGLDQIKDVTRRTIDSIIHGRPFVSLDDFLTRVNPRPQEAENLTRVGGLEGLGKIPAILQRLQTGALWRAGQMSLFAWNDTSGEEWSLEQKVAAQQELLGISVEAHPLELVAGKIAAARALSILDAVGRIGQRVTVAGVRQTAHRSRTAKGEPMMFLNIEDLSGMLDVILFPDTYRQGKNIVSTASPFLITGIMEMDAARGEACLRAEKVVGLV